MEADSRTAGEVKATLQKLSDAYAKRDTNGFLECFVSDADVVLYGTGADEKRIWLEQIGSQVECDWAQTESAVMSFTWISVSAAGPVAWPVVDGAFKFRADGQDGTLPARVSFFSEKREGSWLIAHSHFSTLAASQEQCQSF
jgi:ketosteroid isomerase-like protein